MAKRLKWGSLENLKDLINEYFNDKTNIVCVVGLCLHLGITNETWAYYTSNKWATHRKSEEEVEELSKKIEDTPFEAIFDDEEYIKLSEAMEVIGNCEFSQKSRDENYTIKRQVSEIFKIAQQRIELFYNQQLILKDKPVGAIFYCKSRLGYRETDSDSSNNNGSMPSKITIQIMPAPNQAELQSGKISIKTE